MRIVSNNSKLELNFPANILKYKLKLDKYKNKYKNKTDQIEHIGSKRKRNDGDQVSSQVLKKKKMIITEYTKRTIAFSQKWKCNLCNSLLDPSFDIDHIIPYQYGGRDDKTNFHALCVTCHRYKTYSIDSKILKPILDGTRGITSGTILNIIKESFAKDHSATNVKSEHISFTINKDDRKITVSF